MQQHNGEIPLDLWLVGTERAGYRPNAMWNRLERLLKKGYVYRSSGRVGLKPKAHDFFTSLINQEFESNSLIPIPAQIRIVGQVKAGKTSADVLEFDPQNHATILVPNVRDERRTFVYQVVGDSMNTENIFEGDFVIVEEFAHTSAEQPSIGELIVARYLPYHMRNEFEDQQYSEDDYEGPTLKRYYTRQIDSREVIELSWRGGIKGSSEKLMAVDIIPIGRVIGLFRDLRS